MSLWNRPSIGGVAPVARACHTLTGVGRRHERVFAIGGWNGSSMLADVHVLNTDAMTWTEVFPTDSTRAPTARGGHTACEWRRKLYVFGGGSGTSFVNELHVLDTTKNEWEQVFVAGTPPSPRSRHAAVVTRDKMWVFFGGDDARVYDDMFVFDAVGRTWAQVETTGDAPCARWGHSCTLLGETVVCVFGGHDGQRMLNDIHVLDTETKVWSRIQLDEPRPAPRAGHSANVVAGNLVVFGGGDGERLLNDCWTLAVDEGVPKSWARQMASGAPPSARCAHTAVSFAPPDDHGLDRDHSRLLVFGGGDGARRFKDVYVLQLADKAVPTKRKPRTSSLPPAPVSTPTALGALLDSCGLGHLLDTFLEQEIDLETIPLLKEHHLIELGATTIGARLRLMQKGRELTAASAPETPSQQTTLIQASHQLEESMRHLALASALLTD